jgi:hypothetical protein
MDWNMISRITRLSLFFMALAFMPFIRGCGFASIGFPAVFASGGDESSLIGIFSDITDVNWLGLAINLLFAAALVFLFSRLWTRYGECKPFRWACWSAAGYAALYLVQFVMPWKSLQFYLLLLFPAYILGQLDQVNTLYPDSLDFPLRLSFMAVIVLVFSASYFVGKAILRLKLGGKFIKE